MEDLWTGLWDATMKYAQNPIRRHSGKKSQQWIQETSWNLIHERKSAKLKLDQAKLRKPEWKRAEGMLS